MNLRVFIIGFSAVVHSEARRMMKGFISPFFWFVLMVLLSTYGLSAEKYAGISIDRSLMSFRYGNNPMTDVLIFATSFAISSVSDVLSGKLPGIVFPTSIGVIFFIIFPLMLGLTMMSNFIVKKASTSFAGEKEKKTLHILITSPLTRSSVYIGKFTGIFLLTLPMIFFLYLITEWVFTAMFSSALNLSGAVLETALITALFFISAGMLVSVVFNDEKKASWVGTKIVTVSAMLTTVWLLIPFIEFISNLTNNNTDFLLFLEKITLISPFTLEIMSVYSPADATGDFNIMIIASLLFLILGMVTFIRQDIEY